MYEYLEEHAYISKNKKSNYQFELTRERAECIANKYNSLCEEKDAEIERLNGLINTMLEFNLFGEECPLNLGYTERCDEEKAQDVFYEDDYCEKTCNNDFKKCWLKYFKRLQELKGSDK